MNRRRATSAVVVSALLAAALAACTGGGTSSGSPPSGQGGSAVAIRNFSFSPANIEVKAGSAVTWTNDDTTQHTVTADAGAFSSGKIDPGEKYSFTFAKPGTFAYHCTIHPSMVGQVVVK